MERLTERSENGTAMYCYPTPEPEGWKENRHAVLERCCQYEETGLTPEDINNLIELLRDRCWACENGKPYRIGSRNLTTCKHLNCVAATSNAGCPFWKLKHFVSSQN